MAVAQTKNTLSRANLFKIGLLANTFEWYEFSVVTYLSSIIGKLFFQSSTPLAELIKVFSLLALSYFIRPLGSIFFGLMGDYRGRRYSLRLSLILMTIPTVFIGFLPTYADIGISATVMFGILRMIQGFAMGGELPATACYVFESAPKHSKSLFCATVGAAAKGGLLLGSLTAYLLFRYMDAVTLYQWGWRIPFWLGIPLTLFIAYARRSIEETPAFEDINTEEHSLATQWTKLKRPLTQAIALCIFLNVGFTILSIWMPFYLYTFLNIPVNEANFLNTITLCLMIPICLGAGYLSHYFGYRELFIASIIGTTLMSIPIFWFIQHTNSLLTLMTLHFLLALLAGIGQGIFVEVIGDLLPPSVRSLGFSLSFILPAACVGGTVPLVCTKVVSDTGCLMFPAYYMVFSSVLALPAAIGLKTRSL